MKNKNYLYHILNKVQRLFNINDNRIVKHFGIAWDGNDKIGLVMELLDTDLY